MNGKRIVPLVILLLFSILGSNVVLANSDQPTKKDCKFVYDCMDESGQTKENASLDDEKNETAVVERAGSPTVMTTVKVIFALIFVVVLMIVVLKLLHKRTQIVQQGKGIQTLGGAMVGNQRSVQMVKVGNRILIVGVGDNVSLIKEIDDEDELQTLLSQYEDGSHSVQLKEGLIDWAKKRLGKPSSKTESSFQETLRQRLDEAKKGRNAIYETLKREQNND